MFTFLKSCEILKKYCNPIAVNEFKGFIYSNRIGMYSVKKVETNQLIVVLLSFETA